MSSSNLREARRQFRRGQYGKLISHLEPQVFMYRENEEYYQLLAAACFFTGDYGGCTSYAKRAIDLEPNHTSARTYLAAVFLKRRETDKAIQHWLTILDHDPKNRYAKRGLQFVRTLESIDQLNDRITPKQLRQFVPKPLRIPIRTISALIIIGTLSALLYFFIPVMEIEWPFTQYPPRDGVEVISFPEGQSLTSLEGEYSYILSEREIQEILERIRVYFNSNQDNLVRREINRILLSTATTPVKERVRILQTSLESPDFTNLDTSFSYQQVHQDLPLYQGTYVRWEGRPTNIIRKDDVIEFTLLVGYHTGQVLEGSVPVHVPFATQIRSDMGIDLIGQVRPVADSDHPSGSPFYLHAVTLRMFELE